MSHTPAPWTVNTDGDYLSVYPICERINATYSIDQKKMKAEAFANARLIAAAPELLSALKYLVAYCDTLEEVDFPHALQSDAKQAIAKAESPFPL